MKIKNPLEDTNSQRTNMVEEREAIELGKLRLKVEKLRSKLLDYIPTSVVGTMVRLPVGESVVSTLKKYNKEFSEIKRLSNEFDTKYLSDNHKYPLTDYPPRGLSREEASQYKQDLNSLFGRFQALDETLGVLNWTERDLKSGR